MRILSILLVIGCFNFGTLILARFVRAMAYCLTNVCLSPFLTASIPKTDKKGEIFSHIDGKGYSKYCYIAAISKVLSGYLFTINPYIPLILCLVALTFATIVAYNFIEIEEYTEEKVEKITFQENLKNIKEGLQYIIKSPRLKALMLMLGTIWGLLNLLDTYQTTLLKNLEISATYIGIIAAAVQMITGITSKKANEYNNKFKNKSLTILGIAITIGAMIIGATTILNIPFWLQLIIIITAFCIRHACKGVFQIIKKRYLGNFASNEILPKIYSSNEIICNLMKAIIGYIGSAILLVMDIRKGTLAIGGLFLIVVILISIYMRTRVGIEMKEEK